MAKKNNAEWYKNPWSILGWIVLILLVLVVLYLKTGFDPFGLISWLYSVLAKLWQAILAALGGLGMTIGGGNIAPQGGLPTTDLDCDDYNIASEYDKYFGVVNMQTIERNCVLMGGKWTRNNAEVSCFLGHPGTIDCNSIQYKASKNLCEAMKARSVCDNENGVYGCFCREGGALVPSADESDWECGYYYEGTGYCSGYCDEGACMEKDVLGGKICGCYDDGQGPQDDGDVSCTEYEITTGDSQTAAIQCFTHGGCTGDDNCKVVNNPYDASQRYKCECFDSEIYNSCSYFYNEDDCMSLGRCRGQTPFGDWYETSCGWHPDIGCHCPLIM